MIPLKTPSVISYSISVAKNIDFSIEEFKNIVHYVLQHEKGWKSYGYNFTYLDEKPQKTNNGQFKKHLHITLCNPEDVKKACGTSTLSCYDPSSDKIYINYKNWNGGSKSDLSVADYRIYVICHEVGHGLGFEHTKCPLLVNSEKYCELGSVMQQMSKGPEHIKPCKSNMWPLPYPAEFELQKTATTGLFMGGAWNAPIENYVLGGKWNLPVKNYVFGGAWNLRTENIFSDWNNLIFIFLIILIIIFLGYSINNCFYKSNFQKNNLLQNLKF